ncbi:CPBP family intramembrane glutamic endopeptidase [Haloarchaeobius sp. DFWS5]|uniref:CPBP family intramembrane glutamic endopeptidase n=1 Tax=Haloarchaeobius sp. DFWS5 TaxID=3446114 RepID=UPI003EC04607
MNDSLASGEGGGSPGSGPETSVAGTIKSVLQLALLGFSSLAVLLVYQIVLYVGATATFGSIDTGSAAAQVISVLSLGLATGSLAALYIRYSDLDWSFVDLKWPSLRDVGLALGGFVVLLLGFFAVTQLFTILGINTAQHSTTESASQSGNPALLLPLIPLSLLIIGPGEELLYRNVIQKSLYPKLGKPAAVGVASVIFALVHIPAYAAGGAGWAAVGSTLLVIFVLSLVLGGSYALSGNILVPAFIHGLYNALSFYATYTQMVNDSTEALVTLFTLF